MEDVKIPVSIEVKSDADTELDRLVQRLELVKKTMESAPKNDMMSSLKENVQETVKAIDDEISKLAEMSKTADKSAASAKSLSQQVMAVSKAMKSGKGEGANTTPEQLDALKDAWKEAKSAAQEYDKAVIEGAKESIPALDKRISQATSQAVKYNVENKYAKPPETAKPLVSEADKLKQKYEAVRDVIAEFDEKIIEAAGNSRQLSKIAGEIVAKYNQGEPLGAKALGEMKSFVNMRNAELEAQRNSEKAQDGITNAVRRTAKASNNVANSNRKATAQIYYQLRAVKMMSNEVQKLNSHVNNWGKQFTSALAKSFTGLMKLGTGMALFGKHADKARKSQDGFTKSMKVGFTTVLKYVFGIRSLYFLFRKLRKALGESMGELASSSSLVNDQMSSLMSNVSWMKKMMATIAQPLLNVLVPALDAVANAFNNAAKAVASFFATLTGQSFIFKAIKPTEDYAAALDKTAGSAKKAKDNVQAFDELHVISDDNGGGGGANAGQFEMAETESAASELAKKVKDIMSTIFDPIKKAWEEKGQFVMDAWKYAIQEVGGLIKQVGQDFLTVWSNDTGVHIWENIFQIVGDVGLVIGNIANNLTEAWIEGEKGLHIFEGIQRLIDIIIQGITNCADATVIWSQNLDFNPILESLLGLIQALESPIQHLTDLFEYLYKNVVLPFMKYMVESGLPSLLDKLGEIPNMIDWDLLQERMQTLMDAFEPFLEKVWEAFVLVLDDLGQAIADLVNSDGFGQFVDLLVQLMQDADPRDIADAIETLAEALIGLKIFSSITGGVLGFLEAMLAIKVLFANFGLSAFISGIAEGLAPLLPLIGIIGGLVTAFSAFFDMLMNGFNWLKEILMWIGIAIAAVAAVVAGIVTGPIAALIAAIAGVVMTAVVLIKDNWGAITKFFSDVWSAITQFFANAVKAIGDFFNSVGEWIANAWATIQEFFATIWNGVVEFFSNVINHIVEFFTNIVDKATAMWNALMSILGVIGGWVDSTIIQPIKNFVHNLVENIKNFVTNLINNIKSALNTFKTFISNVFTAIFNFFKDKVYTPVSTFFINLMDGIKQKFQDGINFMKGIINKVVGFVTDKIIDPVAELFDKLWEGLTNGIKTAVNTVIGTVESMVNAIIKAINTLSWDVPDWVPGIGGSHWGFDIPEVSLPRLAQGAVIPPNKEFMAILGDQKNGTNIEAPLTTIQDAVALVLQPYLERLIAITEDIYEKDMSVNIGDAEIARANIRGQRQLGARLRTQ